MVLLLTAFRTAWPAFAYSIRDDAEARRTYAFVLTYLVVVASWARARARPAVAVARAPARDAGVLRGLRASSRRSRSAAVAYAAYIVMAIGVGRAKRTQFNWVITGAAALLNVALNLLLIPPYGMMGAAVATVAAYSLMFVLMTWYAQRVFPVPYQWRRVLTAAAAAVALVVAGKLLDVGLAARAPAGARLPARCSRSLGFFLPDERARCGRSWRARLGGRARCGARTSSRRRDGQMTVTRRPLLRPPLLARAH